MNRTIKFRGLRRDGLGWAYGWLCPDKDGDLNIITEQPWQPIFRFKVHPETVGQFTGLRDRNGKEIYEGDVYTTYGDLKYTVSFSHGAFCGGISHELSVPLSWNFCDESKEIEVSDWVSDKVTVIGNIHEPCSQPNA